MSREKALQTVVAGQQAENLLDFDAEEPTSAGGDSFGGLGSLRDTQEPTISQSQIASAAKAVNPLDELMDLFSSASMQAPQGQPTGVPQLSANPAGASNGGMSAGGGGAFAGMEDLMSPTSLSPAQTGSHGTAQQQQQQKQGAQEDLLGLF